MPDTHPQTSTELEVKSAYYYEKFDQKYSKEKIKKAIEYMSYKHADALPKTESDTEPTIYVFRHGQSEDNLNFVFSGWREAKITEKGIEQALVIADKIKNKKLQMLISSPQIRALDTMKYAISKNEFAKNLEVHTDKRIMERSYGDLQGENKLKYYLEDAQELESVRRNFKHAPPNGESIEDVCKRVAEFCDEIVPLMKQNKINVAVSCHGNSIRGFRRYFEHLSDTETAHIETPLGQDYLAYVIK